MSLRKYLQLLLALTLVLAVACGKGKEVVEENEGEDDQAPPATASAESGSTAATAAAAPVAADAGTITGTVKFEGAAAPKMAAIQMGADPYCASQHSTPATDEEVVVGPAGELANVIVYIKDIKGNFPAPSTPVVLNQQGCQYHPHTNVIQVGQPLEIKNSDATLHNVHAMPETNRQFNEGQPVQGMVSTKKFDAVEMKPFRIKCDVHGWMKSYMAVLPHPFHGVSQMNGTFTIANLPPGSYTLVAWHEKYGSQEQPITVGPKEQKQVAFTFKG
jgi:plastocyanin